MSLVLIRHGQSIWNQQDRFTGWTDVDLSKQGVHEAHEAARILKKKNLSFDLVYASALKRAINTANIIKNELEIPGELIKHWRLNERHYGALQGKNKKETIKTYGEEQVLIWRRSYNTPPPLLTEEMEKQQGDIPLILGESLEDTLKRVIVYWEEEIYPRLKQQKKILIAAHGNSLRALMKHLFSIDKESILKLEIPTGKPILCEFDQNFKASKYQYLK